MRLVPFEASVPQDLQVHATVVWSGSGQLNLSYGLLSRTGLGDLVLPRGLIDGLQPDGVRRDGLWDTTCFEAFLGLPGDTLYWEINLAANGDWALYGFSDYRDGRSDPSQTVPPRFSSAAGIISSVLKPALISAPAGPQMSVQTSP